jgi:hypothetical protein
VKEEQDGEDAMKAVQIVEYEQRQLLITNNDDPEDWLGLHAVFMASMNDKDAWRGDVDVVIAMSIRDAGMPIVDLNNDDEVGPSGAVKDEPDERGKQDVVDDDVYNLHQYYDPSRRRKYY